MGCRLEYDCGNIAILFFQEVQNILRARCKISYEDARYPWDGMHGGAKYLEVPNIPGYDCHRGTARYLFNLL